MKNRIFSKLIKGMLVAATVFTFTSCGDDDYEPKEDDNFTTEYTFTAEFSTDLVKTASVKVYVLSPMGILTEETITKEKNSWTLKGNSIPDKSGVMFEFDAKSNIPEGEYKLGYKTTTTVKCLNKGGVISFKSEDSELNFTVSAEQLPNVYGTSLTMGGEINSQGETRVTDGSDIDFGLNGGSHRPPLSRPQGGR